MSTTSCSKKPNIISPDRRALIESSQILTARANNGEKRTNPKSPIHHSSQVMQGRSNQQSRGGKQ